MSVQSMMPAGGVEADLVAVRLRLLHEAAPLLGRRRPPLTEHVAIAPRLGHTLAVIEGRRTGHGLAFVQREMERLLLVLRHADEEVHAHVVRPNVRR